MDWMPMTPEYQQGVDAARCAAFRVLRALEVPDDVFYSVAAATEEVRRKRPLYGAQPAFTDVEAEIARKKIAAILGQ